MVVQFIAGHRLKIAFPTYYTVSVWMNLECGGVYLFVQMKRGVVFAAFALRDDDRAFALKLFWIEGRVDHSVRLDSYS